MCPRVATPAATRPYGRTVRQNRTMTSPTPPTEPSFADRTYRSGAGLVTGALLIVLVGGVAGDAVFRGTGRTPWAALAVLLFVIPLIVAFTLRPAVYANAERIRIRNPFRTIELPWTEVADLRASYTSELFAEGGAKYQLWAVPVSLRERKKAARKASRASQDDPFRRTSVHADVRDAQARMAAADRTMSELRELSEGAVPAPEREATKPSVRWAYEVLAPSAVGAVLLVVLLATG
ncbi:PH domain-containing protein [Streptomyces sp. AmelKG-A3]|nr:PH domain-containing protein [Streptomyces sp. PalvLS-984]SDD99685.1 PH domain-containing protein [Streptomyces sp. AmelKG-A3]